MTGYAGSYCIEAANEPPVSSMSKSSTLLPTSTSKSATPPPTTTRKPSKAAIPAKVLRIKTWNKGVGGTKCSGLWAENYVCVSIIGHTSTPTKPGNGIPTPSPIQPDIIDTCSTFYLIKEGQSCDSVASESGITVKDLVSWNRKAGPNCSGMWANTYACVSVISSYDFEKANMAGWNVTDGTYSAGTKALVGSNSQGGKAIVDAQMNDFIMRAEVTLSSQSGNASLIFRVSNPGRGADAYQGYYVGISAEKGGSITLGRADNNWKQLSSVKANIQPGKKYVVIVEAAGDNIFVSLNSRSDRRITIQDGTFRAGSCGVRVYQTGAAFDNVYIAPMVYDGLEKNMVGWTIVDGGFDGRSGVMTVPKANTAKAILNTSFKDFTVDVDVTLSSTDGNAGIIFRASNVRVGTDSYSGYYLARYSFDEPVAIHWNILHRQDRDLQPFAKLVDSLGEGERQLSEFLVAGMRNSDVPLTRPTSWRPEYVDSAAFTPGGIEFYDSRLSSFTSCLEKGGDAFGQSLLSHQCRSKDSSAVQSAKEFTFKTIQRQHIKLLPATMMIHGTESFEAGGNDHWVQEI
ncbi:hypothetical protein ACHAPE_004019 [Trichoderma viride]